MKPDIVIWLVRDTRRVVDNPALNLATQIADERDALVVPLACLEPAMADQQFGMPTPVRTGRGSVLRVCILRIDCPR